MNATIVKKPLALLLLVALAACSGASPSSPSAANVLPAQGQTRGFHPHRSSLLANIVGVGDSLTAGYQAGGFLGQLGVKNPLNSTPGKNMVPPGQESGWWADLYEQATGTAVGDMYNPATSPLPLIAGPGLDNQIVSSFDTVIGELKSGNACTADNSFNADGFMLSKLSRVRLNPASPYVRDLAIPGITLHEALKMTQPLTTTCEEIPGVPGLLSDVINDESGLFYPVLGGFVNKGVPPSQFTMVHIAANLHPTLVTVWLGANDVLKYMGSGGLFTGGDNTVGQVENDVENVIQSTAGNPSSYVAVAVANLPDVLLTPYFMNMEVPSNANDCNIHQYFYCMLQLFGIQPKPAAALTRKIANEYGLTTKGCTPGSTTNPCGFLTLQGALVIIPALLGGQPIPSLDSNGPGSGLGNHYITPAFAASIANLNNTVNEGIDLAAQAKGAALVDIKTVFDGIWSGSPSNPYFKLAQVNPPTCCTLVYLGGLVSYDGLHPSNTGYALIAHAFIDAINAKYNALIPQVPIDAIYMGKPPYRLPDPYAPQFIGDQKIVSDGHGHFTISRISGTPF